MTVKELRKALKKMPKNAVVFHSGGQADDALPLIMLTLEGLDKHGHLVRGHISKKSRVVYIS